MIESEAVVVATEGSLAWVVANRSSSCGHCDAAGSCGGSLFSKLFGSREVRVEADNAIHASVGERVILGLPERVMITGSMSLYLLPLLGLFVGALLGEYFAGRLSAESTEPWAALGGLLGVTVVPVLYRKAFPVQDEKRACAVIIRRAGAGLTVEPPIVEKEKEK